MVICATIGGANNWVEVSYFCKDHKKWFTDFLQIDCGIPSHDTFNRIFNLILPSELSFWLLLWIGDVFPKLKEQDIVHLDGKILKAYSSAHPLTIIRAWSEQLNCTVGMIKVPSKTNEIGGLPPLLQSLYLKGKIVTIDAIGAQKEIVKIITKKNADYVIALKGNQQQFYQDVKLFMDDLLNGNNNEPRDLADQLDCDHGRIERRLCVVTKNISWLHQKNEWKNLKSLAVIKTTGWRNNKQICGRRYFISSLSVLPKQFLQIARSHWSIENKLHWPLDRYFDEDRSTIRDTFGAQNTSLLRSISIGLLQRDQRKRPTRSLAAKRQEINRNPQLLETLLN